MGRLKNKSLFEVVGDVEPEHITELGEAERGIKPPPLVRIRTQHHGLAKLLASGVKPGEAALITGMHPSRVSILQNDPAFQELMQFFLQKKDGLFLDVMQHVQDLSMDSLLTLKERIQENPDKISTGDLLSIINTSLDRLGYAPAQKHVHVHTDLGELKRSVDAARRGKVVSADRRFNVGRVDGEGDAARPTQPDAAQRLVISTEGDEVPDAEILLELEG